MSELIVQNEKKLFVENVQKWLLYEQQLKLVSDKSKQIRESKNKVTEFIIEYMEKNKLTQNKIKISDGELRVHEKKEYAPLTYAYLEECLAELIPDKEHVEYILNYLKNNRETKISKEIRRIQNK
jgi:hypothetical protein